MEQRTDITAELEGTSLFTGLVIRRFFLISTVYSVGSSVVAAYYPVFLRSHGLSQFRANSLLALSFVVIFLADMPTGAFADVVGRSRAFILGNVIRGCGWFLYYCSTSFGRFVIAESTSAVGFTFSNGALEAWAVDTLDKTGFKGDKTRIFSRVIQLMGVAAMAGAILGSYSAQYAVGLPWVIGSGILFATAIGGWLLMVEQKLVKDHLGEGVIAHVRVRLQSGFSLAGANKSILLLACASGIQIGAWAPYEMEWQKYFMDSLYVRMGVVGLIYCLFKMANVMGSEITARSIPSISMRQNYVGLSTLISGLVMWSAGYFVAKPWVVLVLLSAANLCFGVGAPVLRAWANEEIVSTHRATLLSLLSTFGTLGGALGLLAGGRLVDLFGLAVAWQISGLLVVCSAPLIFIAAKVSDSRRLAMLQGAG